VFYHRYPIEACVVRKTVPSGALTGYEAFETKYPASGRTATES